jgi:TonB-linked SusC/RagA family outer membrane protein
MLCDLTKTLRVMKLLAIILLTACLAASANGHSQVITYSGQNVKVETVFAVIKQQSGYSFFYNNEDLQAATPVTVNLKNEPLEKALQLILANQPLQFSIEEKTVFIIKKNIPASPVINEIPQPAFIDITGKVTDKEGNPLQGASITIKGTNKGTTTNSRGEFVLTGTNATDEIVISNAEYISQTIKLNGRYNLNVSLEINDNPLDQVQVIAYGKTSSRVATGSSTTITSKQIEQQPVSNPLLTLAGRVPGLIVNQTTGFSASGLKVQIRGQNYLNGSTLTNDPLYVIDGIPYTAQLLGSLSGILGTSGYNPSGNPFSFINPDDIESIAVLKDADATSIYGTRAANGAILITTKKGKNAGTQISINIQNGFGKVTHFLPVMNSAQYLQMRHEALKNDNALPALNDWDLNGDWDTTKSHNWQKELIGGTANYLNYNASISGGTNLVQYLVSGTYHRETTVFPSDLGSQKADLHFNIGTSSANQKFHAALTGGYMFDDNRLPNKDLTSLATSLAPIAPDLITDGKINWGNNSAGVSTLWYNPMAYLLQPYVRKTNNLIGNLQLNYDILSNLKFSTNLGYTDLVSNETIILPLSAQPDDTKSFASRGAFFLNQDIHSWLVEPQLNYSHFIGKGKVEVLLGSQLNQNFTNGTTIDALGQSSDETLLNLSAANFFGVKSLPIAVYKYASLYTRLNYNLNNKYIINISGRRDGSSRFGPANRFANFGSVAAAWIFSEVKFIKSELPWLSFGKLRSSYGTTGSDQIGDYQYMNLYSVSSTTINYQNIVGLLPNGFPNPNLQWGITKKFDIAATLGFLKDRVTVEMNFFLNRSGNQLGGFQLPIFTGYPAYIKNLPILTQQKGWEFSLSTKNIQTKTVSWTSNINMSVGRNKLLSAANIPFWLQREGLPFSGYFVYHYVSLDPASGLYQFSDGNGGVTTTPQFNSSKTLNSFVDLNPRFSGGFSNTVTYKNFAIDFLLQFTKQTAFGLFMGNDIPGKFNANQPTWLLDRWKSPGDVATYQAYTAQNSTLVDSYTNITNSDAAYVDASYIRLKNVSLSWQTPVVLAQKLGLKNLKLYAHAQNVFTITKYLGLDPETFNGVLPPLRVISFGIHAGL